MVHVAENVATRVIHGQFHHNVFPTGLGGGLVAQFRMLSDEYWNELKIH